MKLILLRTDVKLLVKNPPQMFSAIRGKRWRH